MIAFGGHINKACMRLTGRYYSGHERDRPVQIPFSLIRYVVTSVTWGHHSASLVGVGLVHASAHMYLILC